MRVYQIAEEVKLSNRVLVQLLQDQGVDINSHMAPLSGADRPLLQADAKASPLASEDFNGDGRADVLWALGQLGDRTAVL